MPDSPEYRRLLADVFHSLTYYDDVFYPVNELAELVGQGGWHGEHHVPARINLLVTPGRGVGMFRLIPAFARSWIGWEQLETHFADQSVVPAIFKQHQHSFAWDTNLFCGRCSWRFLCGGTDGWDGPSDSDSVTLRTTCEYRPDFLEVFEVDPIV
ncbi:MAG TPA: hypothetical protein VKA46_24980 [Gemmataceae bacterium]|nr:hypothetical protein [Gemmataceae bacterium]